MRLSVWRSVISFLEMDPDLEKNLSDKAISHAEGLPLFNQTMAISDPAEALL